MKKEVIMNTELRAPRGMFRVVGLDLKNNKDYLVKDCQTKKEALALMDWHNGKREGQVDVYYVYDDKGTYLPGKEKINRDPEVGNYSMMIRDLAFKKFNPAREVRI